jgi:hypothetical protein
MNKSSLNHRRLQQVDPKIEGSDQLGLHSEHHRNWIRSAATELNGEQQVKAINYR